MCIVENLMLQFNNLNYYSSSFRIIMGKEVGREQDGVGVRVWDTAFWIYVPRSWCMITEPNMFETYCISSKILLAQKEWLCSREINNF